MKLSLLVALAVGYLLTADGVVAGGGNTYDDGYHKSPTPSPTPKPTTPKPTTPAPTSSTSQCGQPLANVLFVGKDLSFVIKNSLTAAGCCELCGEKSGCEAYSLVSVLGVKTCFLKSGVGLKIENPFGVTATSGAMVKTTPTPTPVPTAAPTKTPAPTSAAPQPTTATPQPTTATPEPTTATPEPTTSTPEPSTTTPEPSTTTPEPTTTTPEPSTTTPEPTTATPEPTTATPEPTTSTPEPTTATPEPTTATPESTPEPTTVTPEPTTATPEPTTATPEPTTATPQPTTLTPQPTTLTPQPTTATPQPTTATPSPSTGMTCGIQLKNIYYSGFNLQTTTVANAAACCDLCTAYSGCVLYTYFHSSSTGQSLCYLKSGAGEKTNYADSSSVTAVSALMVAATPAPTPTSTATPEPTATPTPTTEAPSVCYEQLEGVFYNDNTIYEFTIDSADQCCEYCSDLAGEGCVLYTLYVSESEGMQRCLLKSAAGETTNYTNSADLNVVSAFLIIPETPAPTPTTECTVAEGQYCGNAEGTTCCESDSYCQPWNNDYYQCIGLPDGCGNLETDVDYYGNDLSSALTLYPWLCCSLCQETEGCTAYTFVNLDPSGPTCYMKTSSAGRVASTGALSGVPLNSSSNSSA
ncbi:hypothetical protein BBJ28_00026037 [Nothophytophthora sp. Chile5]|nr:hypothetical protein BBJ28_00026037 [Nothophytophthora sp. Chile5]